MTKAEILVRHFARCFREYRNCTPDAKAAVERLATTVTDPDVTQTALANAISTLANLLFPDGVEGDGFAARVARLLRRKGLDQRDLADALRVSEPAVSRILSGRHRPRRRTIERIAVALDVQPGELLPV
jgi:DNA-binding Xre family transcriptional regulator